MKKILYPLIAVCLMTTNSCSDFFAGEPGSILVSINPQNFPDAQVCSSPSGTTSSGHLPDTDDFFLEVKDSDGRICYEGRFGDSPESLSVPAGSYTVSAFSDYFDSPEYSKPQYGDSQVIVVGSGECVSAELYCRQINSGLRLSVNDSFMDCFPYASLYMKSADGELLWDYGETRTAFFAPGTVVVSMEDAGLSQNLFSRRLEAQQILTIRLSASIEEGSGGITLQLDSSRTWLSDNFTFGDDNASEIWGAYDVNQARQHGGKENVWVKGYIVGVASGTSKIDFEPPFDKNTNIILGLRSGTSDKNYCLSVELKSGVLRDELNLMDNPQLLGSHIYMKGDLVSAYYGIPGLKNLEEYQLGD